MASSRPACSAHRPTPSRSPNASISSSARAAKDKHISTGTRTINSFNCRFRTGPKWRAGSTVRAMATRSMDFSRPVVPRCLECHASYFDAVTDAGVANRYRRTDYVLGVSCERCHGPGKQHAELNAPGAPKPVDQAIVNPAKLPRDRQLALCSLCHGGIGVAKAPAVLFQGRRRAGRFSQARRFRKKTKRSTFTAIRWRCWSEASVSSRRR